MVKCTTLTTSVGNLIGGNQNSITAGAHGGSTLLEKVMKTIGKIATASAVAFSAFAFTRRQGRPPGWGEPSHRRTSTACHMMQEGRTAASQVMRCGEAEASGQAAECYGNTLQTIKILGALAFSKDHAFD